MSDWRAEADCKQLASIVQNAKAEASVKRLSGGVAPSGFDMESQDVPPHTFGEYGFERGTPKPFAPVAGTNIQIVDEPIETAIFHAVAKSEHRIAGWLAIVESDPDGALGLITQEGAEAFARPLTIKQELRLCVELPHKRNEKGHVLCGGAARRDHSIAARLDEAALLDGGADEGGEQRVWLERPRFQLWVELHADEPGVVGNLDDLGQEAVG